MPDHNPAIEMKLQRDTSNFQSNPPKPDDNYRHQPPAAVNSLFTGEKSTHPIIELFHDKHPNSLKSRKTPVTTTFISHIIKTSKKAANRSNKLP